jgi:hypothetical protein
LIRALKDCGITAIAAHTVADAKRHICANVPDVAVVDMRLPPGEGEDLFESHAGFQSGVMLARWIKSHYPQMRLVGYSYAEDAARWFCKHGDGFIGKNASIGAVVGRIRALTQGGPTPWPRSFIVHGHDELAKLQLKNYVQNVLHFPEPIILHERPSFGRTIIEKIGRGV